VPVSGDDMEVEKETATGQAVVMNEHADGRIIMLDASFGVQNKVTLLRGLAVDLTHPPLWMVVVRVGCVSFGRVFPGIVGQKHTSAIASWRTRFPRRDFFSSPWNDRVLPIGSLASH